MLSVSRVIKYEGDNSTFIWKHPCEDFNSGTQLIVHESQEAVFYMNGQALDTLGPGRHTLETQNVPLLSKIFNRVTGGDSPFHCEVYFINKTEQMAIKWGTDTRMEYIEPTFNFPVKIGACGEMTLRIDDGRKLLIKVVGTENYLDQSDVVKKLRAFLLIKLKPYMVTYIRENKINIFEIDEHLQIISESMHGMLTESFSEYGLSLEHFFITTVMKPEDDKNFNYFRDLYFRQYASVAEAKLQQQLGIIQQQTEARKTVIEAQALAQKRTLEGYTYQQERQFDVAEQFAANESTGQFANMGVGLGMISGIGNAVGDQVGGVVQNALNGTAQTAANFTEPIPGNQKCRKCGTEIPDSSKFCLECGTKVEPPLKDNEMICPNCQKKITKGKFCLECGAVLISKCINCQAELPSGAKFCLECGTKIN